MKLTSMKLDAAEQKQESPTTADDDNKPQYPYGTCLCLDNVALTKLEMDSLPSVGDKIYVYAEATVRSVSAYENEGGASRSLDLQLTDIALEPDSDTTNLANKLYSKA